MANEPIPPFILEEIERMKRDDEKIREQQQQFFDESKRIRDSLLKPVKPQLSDVITDPELLRLTQILQAQPILLQAVLAWVDKKMLEVAKATEEILTGS